MTLQKRERRMSVGKHAKTLKILDAAIEILSENNPMTVRQVYYQLVSRQS
jgi:DNA topoisomerase VI subunit A